MKRIPLAAALVLAGGALLALAGGRGEPTPVPTAPPAQSTPRWVPAVRVAAPDPLLGPTVPVHGGEPLPPASVAPPPPEAPRPRQATLPGGLLGELIVILNETKSVDTFAVTCHLLAKMGAEAQPAVPAILRNAERLGLLKKRLLSGKKDQRPGVTDSLAEMLEQIVVPQGDPRASQDQRHAEAEPAQAPPCPGAWPFTTPPPPPPPMPPASDR
jgi:hypothetical protein